MVIVQQSAEARATGDLAICPVVIRRTDVPEELATDALVKPRRILPQSFDNLRHEFPDSTGAEEAVLRRFATMRDARSRMRDVPHSGQ